MTRTRFMAVSIVATLTFATNILGFGREILIARAFGTSAEADAFVTAFTIVAACFLVFSAATVQSTFMPAFQHALKDSKERAAGLFYGVFALLLGVMIAIAIALIVFSSLWVNIVVPGFGQEKTELTAYVLRWLAPMVIFFGTGTLLQSVCHVQGRFGAPALVPLSNNVVIILFLIAVVPVLGLTGLAMGYLAGATLWWFLAWTTRSDIFLKSYEPPRREELYKLFLSTLPLLILLAADQLSALIQKTLVSDLTTGSIAALNYAARLSGLPIGVFAMAIATVFFPMFTKANAEGDKEAAHRHFREGAATLLLILLPVSILFIWGAEVLVQFVYERGEFGPDSTARTALALQFYALGMVPQSYIVFFNRVFFAARDTKTPMLVGLFCVLIHILSSWIAVEAIGYSGIAIGTTIYALCYCLLLFYQLHKAGVDDRGKIARSFWRIGVSAAAMAGLLVFLPASSFPMLAISAALAGAVYLAILAALREPSLVTTIQWIKMRLSRVSDSQAKRETRDD